MQFRKLVQTVGVILIASEPLPANIRFVQSWDIVDKFVHLLALVKEAPVEKKSIHLNRFNDLALVKRISRKKGRDRAIGCLIAQLKNQRVDSHFYGIRLLLNWLDELTNLRDPDQAFDNRYQISRWQERDPDARNIIGAIKINICSILNALKRSSVSQEFNQVVRRYLKLNEQGESINGPGPGSGYRENLYKLIVN